MTTEQYGTPPEQNTPNPSQSMIGPRTSTSGASLSNADLRRRDRPNAIGKVEEGFKRKNEVEAAHRLRAAKVLQAERTPTLTDSLEEAGTTQTGDSGSQVIFDSITDAPRGPSKWVRRIVLAALVAFPSIGGISYACETVDKDPKAQAKSTPANGQQPDEPNPSSGPQEEATEEGDVEDTENDEGALILSEEDEVRLTLEKQAFLDFPETYIDTINHQLESLSTDEAALNKLIRKIATLNIILNEWGINCFQKDKNELLPLDKCYKTKYSTDLILLKNLEEKIGILSNNLLDHKNVNLIQKALDNRKPAAAPKEELKVKRTMAGKRKKIAQVLKENTKEGRNIGKCIEEENEGDLCMGNEWPIHSADDYERLVRISEILARNLETVRKYL